MSATYILSIDPGDTTGWVVLTPDGKIIETGATGIDELPFLWERIREIYSRETHSRETHSRETHSWEIYSSKSYPHISTGLVSSPTVSSTLLVVSERFSVRTLSVRKYADMYRMITDTFPGVVWVTPGVWKTTRTAVLALRKGKPPVLGSEHQFDAYRLGLWFIDKYLKNEE